MLDVDLVAVIYSEWRTETSKDAPSTKALARTVFGIYDRSGAQLYAAQRDATGAGKIGVFGVAEVTSETIGGWVNAYQTGLEAMIESL